MTNRAAAIARLEAARDRTRAALKRLARSSARAWGDIPDTFAAVLDAAVDLVLLEAALEAAVDAPAGKLEAEVRRALVACAEAIDTVLEADGRAREPELRLPHRRSPPTKGRPRC